MTTKRNTRLYQKEHVSLYSYWLEVKRGLRLP